MSTIDRVETDGPRIAGRLQRIGKSATLAAAEKAARLRAQGVDVVDLGPGQPDFDTPEAIRRAAQDALESGKTRYTPAAGIPELRAAIAAMYSERDGLEVAPGQTIVAAGGKQALHNALMVLVEDGDEVVIPTPYWVSYPEQVRLAGGKPVFVDASEEDGFVARASAVAEACTDRTRVIILNTPSNPSGAVIPGDEVRAFVDLCRDRGIILLFDECYDRLVYEGAEHVSPFALGAEGRDVSVVCGSCSKTYAMTGWRVGYAAGPRPVIDAMTRLQSHTTSNVTSISQYAAVAALTGDQGPVERMAAAFAERRVAVMPRIRRLPGVSCVEPAGAFYAFPNVERLLGDALPTAADLCTYLIDEAHVVTVPGTAFGRDGYLRLSFATSLERLEEGLDRLERACEEVAAG